MRFGGRGEALLAFCYIICCALAIPEDFDWVVLGIGLVIGWALVIAPVSSAAPSLFLLGAVVALFTFDTEFSFLIGLTGFLILEVQARTGAWGWLGISSMLLLSWFLFGEPTTSWSMSPSVVPLLGVIGILLAVTIGVARKSTEDLKARHEAEVNVAMLETRMDVARQLHLGAIDSLTRLIALAHEVSPELESEARQASLRLRELLNSLSSGKRTTSPLDLVAEVKEGISALRKSGMTVHSRLGRNRCPVDPSVAFLARELLTNALKYGASEVRIELERHGEDAMLLIANDFRNSDTETVDASRSSGFGLEHIGGLAAASGARLHIYEFGETMTCVLECSTVASLKKENDRDFAPGS